MIYVHLLIDLVGKEISWTEGCNLMTIGKFILTQYAIMTVATYHICHPSTKMEHAEHDGDGLHLERR
jgi:hypothetical protein